MAKINNERLAQFDAMDPKDQEQILSGYDEPTRAEIQHSYSAWKKKKDDTSTAEALFRGGAKGATLNWDNEIAGAAGALTDKAYRGIWNLTHPNSQVRNDLGEEYRQNKEEYTSRSDKVEAAHPTAFKGSELGGTALTALVPGAQIGSGLKGAMATGAAFGGVSALGGSKADLTSGKAKDWEQAGLDTLIGTGAGTAGGTLGYGAAKGLGAIADKASDSAAMMAFRATYPKLRDLRTVSQEEALDIGRQILKEKVPLFGKTSEGIAKGLEPVKKEAGQDISNIMQEAQGAAEGEGKYLDRTDIANKLKQGAASRFKTSAEEPLRQTAEDEANKLAEHYAQPSSEPLSYPALHAEKVKMAARGRFDQPSPSDTSKAYRTMAHDLRDALESNMKDLSPELHQRLLTANERYSNLAPAERMAHDSALRNLANQFGVPALDILTGLSTLGATGDAKKSALGALGAHLVLTRGRGSAAASAELLSKLFSGAGGAVGAIPAGLTGKLSSDLMDRAFADEMLNKEKP